MEARADRNCTLVGFDQRQWTGARVKDDVYMGRLPILPVTRCRRGHECGDIVESPAVGEPPEDIESNGCPGGWYRSPFVGSVFRHFRRRLEGGQRVPSLRPCDDDVVIEAIEEYERCEEDWYYAAHQARERKREQG